MALVGVCYRISDQEVDDTFYRQLKAASRSQALLLVQDFTLTSSGEATHQSTNESEGSWEALGTASCHR